MFRVNKEQEICRLVCACFKYSIVFINYRLIEQNNGCYRCLSGFANLLLIFKYLKL